MTKKFAPIALASLFISLAAACGSDTLGLPFEVTVDSGSGDAAIDTTNPDAGEEDTTTEDTAPDADEDITEPDVAEPDVAEPDVAEPDVTEPDATTDVEPDVVEPDVVEPDVVEPDVVEPDTTPDVVEPDTTPDVEPDVEPDIATDVTPDVEPDVEPDVPEEFCADTVWRQELPNPPFFDCSRAPTAAISQTVVPNARGYHGLAIGVDGNLYGNDRTSLLRFNRAGDGGLFVPGAGTVEQMAFLEPGGDLVAGDNGGGLERYTPAGARRTLAPDLGIYGVEVGPDGFVYAAGSDGVWRINADTGDSETLLEAEDDFLPHTVTFNADYTLMLIGTVSGFFGAGGSDIIAYEVDCDLTPIGEPLVYGIEVGGGYHDALAFDICGNLYVNDFVDSALFRVVPGEPIEGEIYTLGGEVTRYLDWGLREAPEQSYGHGFVWGTGDNGWRPDAAYMPLPYAGDLVKEVLIGIPGVRWNGRGLIE
jgi:hypothetical protein